MENIKTESYYHKNHDKQKAYRLFQYYKRKHTDLQPELIEKYKIHLPLYIKAKKLIEEIKNKCPEMLEDINI
jgi:hypothetical protein